MGEDRFYWQGIDDRTAVAWYTFTDKHGVTGTEGPVGLVQWGWVTWESLQGVGLSKLVCSRSGYPEWEQEEPPSWNDLEEEWARGARARARAARRTPADVQGEARAAWLAGRGERLLPKQPLESPERFYRRVAAFYRAAMERDGKPTSAIMESAGVPKTTAARWVREARQRGFLPPTQKGRTRA